MVQLNYEIQLKKILAGPSRVYGTLGKDCLPGPCLYNQRRRERPRFALPFPQLLF